MRIRKQRQVCANCDGAGGVPERRAALHEGRMTTAVIMQDCGHCDRGWVEVEIEVPDPGDE